MATQSLISTRALPGRSVLAGVAALALTFTATACGGADNAPTAAPTTTVRLVTHGSWAASPEVLARFTAETGFELEVLPADDAGAMVNQLILTKDAPLGDAVFGIDTTFASRAVEAGILEPYTSPAGGPEQVEHAADESGQLTAVDFSDVCVNADTRLVANGADLTLDDLTKPEFKDQLVVENPTTSSPGLAFLLATIAAKGETGWVAYWQALRDNGVKVVSGWDEAYYAEFSGPSSGGSRPLVVSYASSPPSETPEGAAAPVTAAALGTCFRQVEYAGVLAGAANPQGARRLVDFLLSDAFQADLPSQMWVYPVKAGTALPRAWARFAPLAPEPWTLPAATIAAHRDEWLAEFTDRVLG
ncbi:MAG: thiamine ABC transporter substrate-binding protein [Bifidobacteriaceae bacterium]|jgi:thiamine transport system substrate-binding protein|nr:thiamine ABC transporter substrate-binding protein [Bifidobacteriaceae bacterium]